jgi:hypothetical protein
MAVARRPRIDYRSPLMLVAVAAGTIAAGFKSAITGFGLPS